MELSPDRNRDGSYRIIGLLLSLVSILDQTEVEGSQRTFILILTEKGRFVRQGPPIILFPVQRAGAVLLLWLRMEVMVETVV